VLKLRIEQWKMIRRLIRSKTNNLTLAALVVALSTIISGLLGVLRDRLLAGSFGAGESLDIYFAAFLIPDLVQALLVSGGIAVAFLPIFSEEFGKGKEQGFAFANNLLNVSLFFLVLVCLILFVFTPQLVGLVAPGFGMEQRAKAVVLTRIMFLSPILFGLSSLFSGLLQYFDLFWAYGLAPILYNLGIIFGIVFLAPLFGVYGLGWGVVLGALSHFLIQVPAARSTGFSYRFLFNLKNFRLKKVVSLMGPSSFGSALTQINLMVVTALASTLVSGSIAIFTFARNLNNLPVGIVGVPFAIAVFPLLSKSWQMKKEVFWQNFSSTLKQILFLVMPLSFLIFVLRAQIVRIVLGTGRWGWEETRLTAACLGVFSFSLFGFSLIPFFRKAFYAIQETKIPSWVELVFLFLNVGLCFLFLFVLSFPSFFQQSLVGFLSLEGIEDIRILAFPLALTITAILKVLVLLFLFVRRTGFKDLNQIFAYSKKVFLVSLLMGLMVWFVLRPLSLVFPLTSFWGVFFQAFFGGLAGIFVYVLLALLFRLIELEKLVGLFVQPGD
jgi:putative peptidoglycan lipid II flippase